MNKKLFSILSIFLTITSALAQDLPLTVGDLSLTKADPAWVNYQIFNDLSKVEENNIRTFYFKSEVNSTINEDPILSGSPQFSIIPTGNTDCKTGFVFTTTNNCIIRIKI